MAQDKPGTAGLARAQLARAAARFGRAGLPALVLMTDDERLPDPVAVARRLPRGSLIVVRARKHARREALARALKALTRAKGYKFVVADDPGLAARIGADGIHLTEARAKEAAHWRARRSRWLITAAAHSLRACRAGCDAVLLSPVFATASHPGAPALGAMRARLIARQSPVAVLALGGIDARTVRRLAGGAFAGVAAIGALA
ncbi:MAG TPA: thiamine phosphate synthase [Rhizomicrobium sp.]|nr:thiamine phosphate synthase [Rhizomicrobium sp.]